MEFTDNLASLSEEDIISLYNSVGWEIYTKEPELLFKAFKNSDYILGCLINERLVGLVRCISDDVSINYIQDILVSPDFQGQGIGKILLEKCLEKFKHVRTHILLTDDQEKQHKFYQTMNLKNIKLLQEYTLNVFVKMRDIDLK